LEEIVKNTSQPFTVFEALGEAVIVVPHKNKSNANNMTIIHHCITSSILLEFVESFIHVCHHNNNKFKSIVIVTFSSSLSAFS
jgi:hypothetical protein